MGTKVKDRPKRPPAGRSRLDATAVINPDPNKVYRWADKSNRLHWRRLTLEQGYEPVKWGEKEGDPEAPLLGHKGTDGFIHGGDERAGRSDLILVAADKKEHTKRKQRERLANDYSLKRHKEGYVQEAVAAGVMTEEQAKEALKSGIRVQQRDHG